MAKDMLGTVVQKLVTLPDFMLGIVYDLLEKLADQEWHDALKKFLRKENPWVVTSLLKDAGTVTIPAIPKFDVAAHFREITEEDLKTAEVPIGFMNDNAKLIVKDMVEVGVAAATLRQHMLLENSADIPIIVELGGAQNVMSITTSWGQMYEAMKVLGHGLSFTSYIPDADDTIWGVRFRWQPGYGYWDVYAFPGTRREWYPGDRVVSH